MAASVSALIDERLHEASRGAFARALAIAALLHVGTAFAAWIGPRLARSDEKPVAYVAVQILPAARLGIETPKPAPEPVKPAEPPPPEPAAAKPEPKRSAPTPSTKPSAAPANPSARPAEPTPAQPAGVATGAAQGLAPAAAVAAFDSPNFTYGYYIDQMLSLIHAHWVRPPVGSGVELVVGFRIQRNGRLSDIRIVRSSGINSFDLAGLRAVQAASPLPPLPGGFRESSLGVNLRIQ